MFGYVKDPVCKCRVRKKLTFWRAIYQGQTFYFCSDTCKEYFQKDPERYIKGSVSETRDS